MALYTRAQKTSIVFTFHHSEVCNRYSKKSFAYIAFTYGLKVHGFLQAIIDPSKSEIVLKLIKMGIARYFLIILIPLLIILANFQYLVLNLSFYQDLYEKVGVYQSFGSREVVDQATINLFGYFRGKNDLDHNFFSNQAILHLGDVKNLLKLESGLFYLSLATVLVVSSIFIIKKQYQKLASSFFVSSIITITAVVLIGLGLLKAFNSIFLGFHKVFFQNQLWLFPPSDNLIKLFPAQFFASFANSLALNIIISCAVIALITGILAKRVLK